MTTVQITSKIQIDTEELLAGLSQLQTQELEGILLQANVLLAQRKAPNLSASESEILSAINQGLPAHVQARYNELSEKMRVDSILQTEHDELLALVDQIELRDAERLDNLIKLAQLRSVSLDTLVRQLDITPLPIHGEQSPRCRERGSD